eukprot:Nitzschia sp. Nitz4//scaffold7_size249615//221099//222010//NITZ4_001210-RA/size249615-augustus-gene-0.42-mRNA-1//-1//CDS//3329558541//1485//frame0
MPKVKQNCIPYFLKFLTLAVAFVTISLSWAASNTCDFISVQDQDGNPLDGAEYPPFDQAIAANVGILRYEITNSVNGSVTAESECVSYQQRWLDQEYPSVASAQLCAVVAPSLALMGVLWSLCDIFVCNFPGSSIFPAILFLVASGTQLGTFTLIADPVFCFGDSDLSCSPKRGIYWSAASVLLFFVVSIMTCTIPFADPICRSRTHGDEDESTLSGHHTDVSESSMEKIDKSPQKYGMKKVDPTLSSNV